MNRGDRVSGQHGVVRQRIEVARSSFRFTTLSVSRRDIRSESDPLFPLISDPRRIARLIDLALRVTLAWARTASEIHIVCGHHRITMQFRLGGEISDWNEAWSKGEQSLTGEVLEELLGPFEAWVEWAAVSPSEACN